MTPFHTTTTWAEMKRAALTSGVSDIILDTAINLTYVRHGETVTTAHVISQADFDSFLQALSRPVPSPLAHMDDALNLEGFRFRVALLSHFKGVRAVLRFLITAVPRPQDINMPQQLRDAMGLHEGLILICGPNNSGKSTTIASFVQEVAETRAGHIITVEDPIEFLHLDKKSVITQREIGTHEPDYTMALKAILRQAPTHIIIGEIRDEAAAEVALRGAETGRLVLATLHAGSVRFALQRFLDLFPDEKGQFARSVLSQALELLVVQQLIRVADGTRRLAIHEILKKNSAVTNCIRHSQWANLEGEVAFGHQRGQQSFQRSLDQAERRGLLTHDENLQAALRFCKTNQEKES